MTRCSIEDHYRVPWVAFLETRVASSFDVMVMSHELTDAGNDFQEKQFSLSERRTNRSKRTTLPSPSFTLSPSFMYYYIVLHMYIYLLHPPPPYYPYYRYHHQPRHPPQHPHRGQLWHSRYIFCMYVPGCVRLR